MRYLNAIMAFTLCMSMVTSKPAISQTIEFVDYVKNTFTVPIGNAGPLDSMAVTNTNNSLTVTTGTSATNARLQIKGDVEARFKVDDVFGNLYKIFETDSIEGKLQMTFPNVAGTLVSANTSLNTIPSAKSYGHSIVAALNPAGNAQVQRTLDDSAVSQTQPEFNFGSATLTNINFSSPETFITTVAGDVPFSVLANTSAESQATGAGLTAVASNTSKLALRAERIDFSVHITDAEQGTPLSVFWEDGGGIEPGGVIVGENGDAWFTIPEPPSDIDRIWIHATKKDGQRSWYDIRDPSRLRPRIDLRFDGKDEAKLVREIALLTDPSGEKMLATIIDGEKFLGEDFGFIPGQTINVVDGMISGIDSILLKDATGFAVEDESLSSAGLIDEFPNFNGDVVVWSQVSVPAIAITIVTTPGDCNGDGVVDASDLACVRTIEERDVVLASINSLPGDLDGNGDVAFSDFLVLSVNFGQDVSSYTEGDVDVNGNVAFSDFLALSANFGQVPAATAVPEPSGLVLLLLGVSIMGAARQRQLLSRE